MFVLLAIPIPQLPTPAHGRVVPARLGLLLHSIQFEISEFSHLY